MALSETQSAERSDATPTPHVTVRTVEAVVNAASGGVGAGAAEELRAILESYGLSPHIAAPQPEGVAAAVQAAVEANPDVVIILAGDGTAALGAKLAGADGPMIAPLPGGTMNMLPHAIYGDVRWQAALRTALEDGVERPVSGGEVSGADRKTHHFYCAAILGEPTLWALAREALRAGRLRRAWRRARYAFLRAFAGRLRFRIGRGETQKGGALIVVCPLVSRRMESEEALEAAGVHPRGAIDLFRLGLISLFSDWRDDPAVGVESCREARAWARGSIPAVLDGEPHRLRGEQTIRFVPTAFRALAPCRVEPATSAETAATVDAAIAATAATRGRR